MLADAGTLITGIISAIGDLIDFGSAGDSAIGWAALLALAFSGGVIGVGVRLIKKFSKN